MPHHLLFREMLRLSLRNFRTKPVRSILTILGMSVGFGVVVFLVSLGYGLQYILIGNIATTQDSLVTVQVSYPSQTNLYFTPQKIAALAQLPDAAEVSPVASFSGQASAQNGSSPALVSVDIVNPDYFRLMGTAPNVGTIFSTSSPGLVLTSQTLALMNLPTTTAALGQQVSLQVQYENDLTGTTTVVNSPAPVPIVGIISDDTQPPLIILPGSALDSPPTFFQSLLIKAKSVNDVSTLQNELVDQGFAVTARLDLVNQARQIANIITIVLGVFGITALIVSAIGMFNTMIVSFMERTYEVGILKSLGATDGDVRNLFLVESAFMGGVGGAGGVFFGYLAGQMINLGLLILVRHLGGKSFTLFITPLWFAGLTIGFAIVIGLVSGFWPAHRASRLSPKEAFLRK